MTEKYFLSNHHNFISKSCIASNLHDFHYSALLSINTKLTFQDHQQKRAQMIFQCLQGKLLLKV